MVGRKGGGARRGPFASKRVVFSTRLTQETMDMLAAAAERDELSISQKAEQALLASLRAEDPFEKTVAPALDAFVQAARMALAANDGRSPFEDAEVARLLRQAAQKLMEAFPPIAVSSHAPEAAPIMMVDTSAPVEPPSKQVLRTNRLLQVDDHGESEN